MQELGYVFKKGTIYKIPFNNESFDYVYTHDVFHHIDEDGQKEVNHLLGLKELRRVCKNNGFIIIIEANRFNPLFYPHMVLMKKHKHFSQSYFKSIIKNAFANYEINFKFFEAHLYPSRYISVFKLYEWIMENFVPSRFLAYNVAIIKKYGI
jgi:ubiquinone/menaquinone biosynthesis C-methylase UbiE